MFNPVSLFLEENNLYVFIDSKYLITNNEKDNLYLGSPTSTPSLLNNLTLYSNGDTQKRKNYQLDNTGYIGNNNTYLFYDSYFKYIENRNFQQEGLVFDSLNITNLTKNRIFSIGYVQAESSLLIPSVNILGFNYGSDDSLFINDQNAIPVQVTVYYPAVVSIYRNERVIYNNYLNPGIHIINTKNFPSGAYNITIVQKSIYGGSETKTNKYFVKGNYLPRFEQNEFDLNVGYVRKEGNDVFKGVTNRPFFSYGSTKRISNNTAFGYQIMNVDLNNIVLQLNYLNYSENWTSNIAIVGTNFGDFGLGFSLNTALNEINIQSTMRKIWMRDPGNEINQYFLENSQRSSISNIFNYQVGKYQVSNSIKLNHNQNSSLGYEVTMGLARTFEYKQTSIDFSLDLSHNDEQNYIGANLTWSFGKNKSWELNLASAFSQNANTNANLNNDLQITKTFIREEKNNNNLNNSISIGSSGRAFEVSNIQGSYYSDYYSSRAFIGKNRGLTNYIFNFATSYVYLPEVGFSFGYPQRNSGIVLNIFNEDIEKDITYDILINKKKYKAQNINQNYYIPLISFNEFNVEILMNDMVYSVNNNDAKVSLYDGSIFLFQQRIYEKYSIFGTFYDNNGSLIKGQQILGGLHPSLTNEDGFTEVYISKNSNLYIINDKGDKCIFKHLLESNFDREPIIFIDKIYCELE